MGFLDQIKQGARDAVADEARRKATRPVLPVKPVPPVGPVKPVPPVGPIAPVDVVTYNDAKAYQRDAQKRTAAGWRPEHVTQSGDQINVGRTLGKAVLTGGVGLLLTGRSTRGGKITVTWVKPE